MLLGRGGWHNKNSLNFAITLSIPLNYWAQRIVVPLFLATQSLLKLLKIYYMVKK